MDAPQTSTCGGVPGGGGGEGRGVDWSVGGHQRGHVRLLIRGTRPQYVRRTERLQNSAPHTATMSLARQRRKSGDNCVNEFAYGPFNDTVASHAKRQATQLFFNHVG